MNFFKQNILPYIPMYILAGLLCGIGLAILKTTSILTGGFPGMALIINYLSDFSVGIILMALNFPLLFFGYYLKGWEYTLRVIVCMTILSIMVDLIIFLFAHMIPTSSPILSTLIASIFIGSGITLFIRDGGNPGGLMILTQWVSDKTNIALGYLVFIQDFIIVLWGLSTMLTIETFIYSMVCVVAMPCTMLLLRKI